MATQASMDPFHPSALDSSSRKTSRRLVARIGSRTAGLVPGLAVLVLVVYAVLFAAGYRTVAVYSGSMEPELHVGSLAFVKSIDSADVRVGDIITFQDPRTPGRLITHRVAKRFRHDGQVVYRTKGDANPTVDPWTIALPGTVGRTRFDLPVVGYALVYAKTREVRTGLLLLFAAVLLGWVLAKIWRSPKPRPVAEPVVAAEPVAAAEASTRSLLALTGLTLVWVVVRAVRA
jgi:signal peptidase I